MSCAVTVYLFAPVLETLFGARIMAGLTGTVSAVSASSVIAMACRAPVAKTRTLLAGLNPVFTARRV